MKNKDIELPEIQEFLKIARNFNRQINLIRKGDLSKEYDDLVDNTLTNISINLEKNMKG